MKVDNMTRPIAGGLSQLSGVTAFGAEGDGAMTGAGQEKSVLRWGGLAGMIGPIFTILTAVTLFGFVPAAPVGPQGPVIRYPNVSEAYVVGETFYLVSVILSIPFYFALYTALRGRALAPALWGTGLSFLSLAAVAVQAIPRVVFGRISNLYHAADVTPQDQATLGLIWQATQGIFNQLDTAAVIFQTTSYILFGIAMLRNPAFGRRLGGLVVALALVALAGLYLLGIDALLYAPLGLFVLIILPILLGWKVYNLSRVA